MDPLSIKEKNWLGNYWLHFKELNCSGNSDFCFCNYSSLMAYSQLFFEMNFPNHLLMTGIPIFEVKNPSGWMQSLQSARSSSFNSNYCAFLLPLTQSSLISQKGYVPAPLSDTKTTDKVNPILTLMWCHTSLEYGRILPKQHNPGITFLPLPFPTP